MIIRNLDFPECIIELIHYERLILFLVASEIINLDDREIFFDGIQLYLVLVDKMSFKRHYERRFAIDLIVFG